MTTNVDGMAEVLLRERVARQTAVDRLLARSTWDQFVGRTIVPLAAGTFGLLILSAWARTKPEFADTFVGGGLSGLFVLTVAVIQINRRLRALTTILERSGALGQFVAGEAKAQNLAVATPGKG